MWCANSTENTPSENFILSFYSVWVRVFVTRFVHVFEIYTHIAQMRIWAKIQYSNLSFFAARALFAAVQKHKHAHFIYSVNNFTLAFLLFFLLRLIFFFSISVCGFRCAVCCHFLIVIYMRLKNVLHISYILQAQVIYVWFVVFA